VPLYNVDVGVYGVQLAERDGYRCMVTGLWDGDHRPAGSNQMVTTLIACHILKRAVRVFSLDRVRNLILCKIRSLHLEPQFLQAHSAAATWNIIRHYSGMSEQMIQGMETLIDDPSNGFMLEHNIHVNFDQLKWYLVPKPEVSS
jgi:HNH endonuclease